MRDGINAFGFARVTACMPLIHLGDPRQNVHEIVDMAKTACKAGSTVIAFPELSVSGYALDDVFRNQLMINSALQAVLEVAEGTKNLDSLIIVGAPLELDCQLYNTAVVMARGAILGVIPKTYLPNYSEFYEKRQFASAINQTQEVIRLGDHVVPFGVHQLFEIDTVSNLVVGVDVCEDLWAPIPPSTLAALAGATVLVNISASNASVGKANYRRSLVLGHSARCIAGQIYVGQGPGDSTTDLAWDTHSLMAENGVLLAESKRYSTQGSFITAEFDLDRLRADRMRMGTFRDSHATISANKSQWKRHHVSLAPQPVTALDRVIPRNPYVDSNLSVRDEHANEVLQIQVSGLIKRLQSTGLSTLVIGVSGGLDSTLALLVATRAFDILGWDRDQIVGVSMPGFGTSSNTRENAITLMKLLGVNSREIDICESSMQMLRDIEHPAAQGEEVWDVTFENVQAGGRTSLLFRLANQLQGLVLGTGDLSELALGWCTYGVGDHMSHYSVNASVPKTLVKYIIESQAMNPEFNERVKQTLMSIVETPITPELIPIMDSMSTSPQLSEDSVGPFELQDFYMYYTTRYGFTPAKLLFLASQAWGTDLPKSELEHWLRVFNTRFFGQSQFKRSALPNGPKVGNGGNLSPRGDWRAPADLSHDLWVG